jgi:hypothetical protein
MPLNAKFIKNTLNVKYQCNICSDEIETNKVIGLACNPYKHIFCYDCIYDWYKELKKKKYGGNYTMLNMCPICRKNGGLLPLVNNTPFIKGLHYISDSKKSEFDIDDNKICGYKLCSKNGFCQSKGNKLFMGLCGKHKSKKTIPNIEQLEINDLLNNIDDTIFLTENIMTPQKSDNKESIPFSEQNKQSSSDILNVLSIDIINPNKLPKECGVKLKTKDGYCKSKICKKYNGYCGMHKNVVKILNEDTVII